MKSIPTPLKALAAISMCAAMFPTTSAAGESQGDWVTVLRQIQIETGVEYLAVVPAKGQGLSFVPLEEGGSVFELWALLDSPALPHLDGDGVWEGEGGKGGGNSNNRSGLGDGTNPGKGGGTANSPNQGTNNPNNAPHSGGATGGNTGTGGDPPSGGGNQGKGKGKGSSGGDEGGSSDGGGNSAPPAPVAMPQELLLDAKLVDAYMPSASIRIITEDPYPGVPRTRADRPFSVEFDIAGLVPGAAVTAASQVPLKHVGFSYSQPPFIPANRIDNHQFYSGFANQNGVLRWDFSMTNLDGEDPRHVTGVERFSVHVLPDLDAPSDQLAQAEIQIFPLTGISVSGIDEGATYRQPPVVQANYTHLYPESVTWAQVYPGPPQLGTEGTAVPGSFIVISDDVTQHRDATMSSLQSVVQQDGQWTFEILTETPFGIERLYHTHFTLESVLRVEGVIVTSESDD